MKRAVSEGDAGIEGARTLADVVYRKLKADILWSRLAPGEALRSDDLRAKYDVGVSPLREALTRLSSERLVYNSGQRGFRVAPLTVRQVREIADARILIESEALRRSMETGDLAWETGIVAATHSLTRTLMSGELQPEGEAWSEQHRRYHLALLAACGSDWLLATADALFDHAERHRIVAERRRMQVEAAGAISRRDRIQEHEELAQTILRRDVDGALSFIRRHYLLTAETVISGVTEEAGAGAPVASPAGSARRTAIAGMRLRR